MARFRAGDPQATRTLVDEYGDLLFKVVRKHMNPALRSQVDSDDCVQEAWLAFLQKPARQSSFETSRQFKAFLAIVARNKVVDIARRGLTSAGYNVNREARIENNESVAKPTMSHRDTPSKSAIRHELKRSLLQELGPAYRKIGQRILDGADAAAIVAEFGVSQRTFERVRKRIVDQLQVL
jgi:RNA polymerase sigma factor (sigma-70 family)